jgi:hypothetical protein
MAIIAMLGYEKGGANADWEWATQYERRLEGRGLFETGSGLAYLLSIAGNGIAPFLAFVGAFRQGRLLLLAGLAYPLFSFFLLGIKGQILLALLGAFFGLVCRTNRYAKFTQLLLLALLGLAVMSLAEPFFFDTSFLAQIFFRRAFFLVGATQAYFADYILSTLLLTTQNWPIDLATQSNEPITYLVGRVYMQSDLVSANSNAFLVALAAQGVLGYLLAVAFTVAFLCFLDRLYLKAGNQEVLFVALLYSALVCGQAYTVVLITSGIALLAVLVSTMRRQPHEATHRVSMPINVTNPRHAA